MLIDTCNFLPWACPLVVSQGSSSPSPRDGSSSCVYSGAVTPASLLELFFPSPWFFQCNSAREQLSGGGLPSVADLKGFLVLIRAGVFQKNLALTFAWWRSSFASILHQWAHSHSAPEWWGNFKAKKISRQCGKSQWYLMLLAHGLTGTLQGWTVLREKWGFPGRQFLQASNLELSALFSTPGIWEGLSFHRSHANW